MRRFKVGEAAAGLRADVFVASKFPGHSRSLIAKLFEAGEVKNKNGILKPGTKLKGGENIAVDDVRLLETPPQVDLPIIYEDENVVVINKPAGVLTHSKGGFNNEATVASFVADRLDNSISPSNRAGIVHRLDRATGGVIICAKNEVTQKLLQKQFAQRRTKKTYLAVVEGQVDDEELIIDAAIGRNPKKPQTFAVRTDGKAAQTNLKRIKTLDLPALSKVAGLSDSKKMVVCCLLELKPTTGRTHQLRVHLSYIGHPIIGDRVYGSRFKDWPHMLLHAASLELTLPGGDRRVFSASLPEYFP